MMADNKEQRVWVKFCFLLGKSAAETVLMLQEAFKEEVYFLVLPRKLHYVNVSVTSRHTSEVHLAATAAR